MGFNCPNCESENTQRVANIYSSGTSSSTTNTTGVINGLGVSSGEVGVIGGNIHGSSTTKNQTVLASQFAPPKKKDDRFLLAWALAKGVGIGFISVGIINIIGRFFYIIPGIGPVLTGAVQYIAAPLLFCIVIYMFYRTEKARSEECKKYNLTEYAEQMRLWESRFYCHKCSYVFIPPKEQLPEGFNL